MQLIYLYHSGFALLFDRMTVVFDFYEDSLGPNSGCLHSDLLRRPVPLYVLASHFHADHFNPHIFSWREQKADVRYILSKDIWRHRRSCCRDVEAHWLIRTAPTPTTCSPSGPSAQPTWACPSCWKRKG